MSEKPPVTPVLVSAETMPFAVMIGSPGALDAAIADLRAETDAFFVSKGVTVDPSIYVEVYSDYGTAPMPELVPFVIVTVGVRLAGYDHDAATELLEDFAAPSFRYVKVRTLTAEDVKNYTASYKTVNDKYRKQTEVEKAAESGEPVAAETT
jgi:hypothetical protein